MSDEQQQTTGTTTEAQNPAAGAPEANPVAPPEGAPAGGAETQAAPQDEAPIHGLLEGDDPTPPEAGTDGEKPDSDVLGAPEGEYEFKPQEGLPEGFEMSEAVMGEFSRAARELNLSNSAAAKIVDRMAPAIAKAQFAKIEELGKGWISAAYADPDLGGANWKNTMSDAGRAVRQFANERVQKILVSTGLNRNPDIIRMFRDIGRQTGQDRIITGKTATPSKGDPLAALYNNSPELK